MDTVENKVAVITGAASGMGLSFAHRFGRAGAKIVAVDVEEPALNEAVASLTSEGIEATGIITDVSSEESMNAMAAEVFEQHDAVHLLFNNAGVGGGGRMATLETRDWEWTIGVNLWGVIHGLRLFLPHMVEHGDAHIINTASVAGHTSFPSMGPYNATKHAVVTISETLFAEMAEDSPSVGVSVLCPGIVNTRILESERNRPESLIAPGIPEERTEEEQLLRDAVMAHFAAALSPDVVADLVYDAVLNRTFYIFTDGEYADAIAGRHAAIQNGTDPIVGGLL